MFGRWIDPVCACDFFHRWGCWRDRLDDCRTRQSLRANICTQCEHLWKHSLTRSCAQTCLHPVIHPKSSSNPPCNQICMRSLTHPVIPIHMCIHSISFFFVRSFTRSFVHSFIRRFVLWFIHRVSCSSTHATTHSATHLLFAFIVSSPILSFVHAGMLSLLDWVLDPV